MRNRSIKKTLIAILFGAAAAVSAFSVETAQAAGSGQSGTILYPLELKTSTEPAYPYAWDNETDMKQYFAERLPAQKVQANCGESFAYASTTMLGAMMMRKGGVRTANYSESELMNAVYGPDGKNVAKQMGGTTALAAQAMQKWNTASFPKLFDAYQFDRTTGGGDEKARYWIRNYGAVSMVIADFDATNAKRYDAEHFTYSSEQAYASKDDKTGPDQTVTVIGWDDDYPAENFTSKPAANGAWLVRNSMGTGSVFGINTYFWISFEDVGLYPETTAFVADAVSSLRSDVNNHWNEFYHENRKFKDSTGYHSANLFTVSKTYETIDAISFYYDPYAYVPGEERDEKKSPTQGVPVEASRAEIVLWKVGSDGKPMTNDPYCTVVQQKLFGAGLYTVPLTKCITLPYGTTYAVDITLDRGAVAIEAGNQSYTVEKNSYGREIAGTKQFENLPAPSVTIGNGESFFRTGEGAWSDLNGTVVTGKETEEFYLDGDKWVDAEEYFIKNPDADRAGKYLINGFSYGNFCINALTTSGTSSSPYTVLDGETGGNATISLVDERERFYFVDRDLKPAVIVTCNGKTLKEGTDYKLLYTDNFDAGNARIYAIGMGNYIGFLDVTFRIQTVDLQGMERWTPDGDLLAAVVTLKPDEIKGLVYRRYEFTPGVALVTIVLNQQEEKVNSAYYFTEYFDNIDAGPDTAKAWVTAKPKTKNYINSSSQTSFTIQPQDISVATITINPEVNPHTGEPVTPDFTVQWANYTLIKDVEYTYEFTNNIEAGNDATLTIYGTYPDENGRGNYKGSISKSFTIVAGEILEQHVFLSQTIFTYNRQEQRPEITVKIGNQLLEEHTDYEVIWLTECVNAGEKRIRVVSVPPYSGEVEKTFTIERRDISKAPVGKLVLDPDPEEVHYIYTGEPITPTLYATWDGIKLDPEKEYDIEAPDPIYNKNVGTKASVTITGKGNFTGSLTSGFIIYQGDLSDATVTIDPDTFVENGYEIDPDQIVKKTGEGKGIVVELAGRTLIRGEDYNVYLEKNLLPGTAKVTLVGKDNYTGSAETGFTIQAKNGGESSGHGDGDGSDSDINPDPGDGTGEMDDEQILVGGVNLIVKESGVTIAKGQKQKIDKSFSRSCKRFSVKSKKVASVSKKGLLLGKKGGDVIVIGYRKKGKKWEPAEAMRFHVDTPKFTSKTIQARKKGETMNMAFFLDSVNAPEKWTVSDKGTASIKKKTGVLKFKKNSGFVTVTAQFGKGAYSTKTEVRVELNVKKSSYEKPDTTRFAQPEEMEWQEVTLDTEPEESVSEETADRKEKAGLGLKDLVPTGYSYLDPAYKSPFYFNVVILGGNCYYTGKAVRPGVAVELINTFTEDHVLTEGIEYEISGYDNYVDAAQSTDANPPTVYVDIYFSDGDVLTLSQTYTINQFPMTDVVIEPKRFVVPAYSGLPKPIPQVTATVSNMDSKGTLIKTTRNLSEGVDFTVEYVLRGSVVTWPYASMNKNIYSIELTGINNYTGVNKECTVEVVGPEYGAKDLSNAKIVFKNKSASYTYDPVYGVVPKIKVKLGGKKLKEDRDYYLQFSRYTNAGTARLTIMAVGYSIYTGSQTANYTVRPLNIGNCMIRGITKQIWRPNSNGVTCRNLRVSYGEQILGSGSDYTAVYINNTNAGRASVTLKGSGNYTGTITENYKIERKKITLKDATLYIQNITTMNLYPDPMKIDAPRGVQPPVMNILDRTTNATLVPGIDYKVTYENWGAKYRDPKFKKPNPPTIIIKGIGNYKFKYEIHYLMQ